MERKFPRVNVRAVRGCNLNCEYCCTKSNSPTEGRSTPPFPVDKLDRILTENNIDEVSLNGFGESTLLPNFEDLFDMLIKHKTLRQITLFSNICAQSQEWWENQIRKIPEGKWFEIVASLHPSQGNTGRVIQLKEYVDSLPIEGRRVQVHVNIVVSPKTIDKLLEVAKQYPVFFRTHKGYTFDVFSTKEEQQEMIKKIGLSLDISDIVKPVVEHNGQWEVCDVDWGALHIDLDWFYLLSVYTISWDGKDIDYTKKVLSRFKKDEDFIINPPKGNPPKWFQRCQ